ncbi:MAG: RHS repeat domain-containing protein [Nitrospiraceae bacterium]
MTDPLNNVITSFAHDANGNLITTTDPIGNVTQRTYDAVSRLISLTDPRGLMTQFRYDNLNPRHRDCGCPAGRCAGRGAEI